MTTPDEQPSEAPPLVRPYVITKGRGLPDDEQLSLITLVTAADDEQRRPTRRLTPEEQGLLELCAAGYLTVAELAGHTRLPLGVVRILLSGLTEGGFVIVRPPVERASLVDARILEEVLNGLQAKFG
ncbi:DUF742 domain-containing protein [Streptomyces rubellomurinus]|uniref:DUF742 domain-containing protein n=2 Tax=Streptomyces TaxID=1883 RepID=A0A0F2TD55_STRR3|nr:DUF742 domain-containing protein [Streptomyces rubellomurinus]KJS53103.1 hypothetical protein VM98_27290 [Streptomyces rubellomurinus subsp. indigoferus]KJS61089.1 hypothetical protein VM95_16815 [Streptomyces rubellomurinus]